MQTERLLFWYRPGRACDCSCPRHKSPAARCEPRTRVTRTGGFGLRDSGPPSCHPHPAAYRIPPARRLADVLLPALVAALLPPRELLAQGKEGGQAHDTKFEYRIPMRDGKRLFTAVYVPENAEQKYPTRITRTPYCVRP